MDILLLIYNIRFILHVVSVLKGYWDGVAYIITYQQTTRKNTEISDSL